VTNSYIVVLRDGVEASPQTLLSKYKGTLEHTYRAALNGFSVHDISETQARRLAADPRGSHVQRNLRTKIQQNQFGSRLGVWTASTSALCRYAYPDQAGAGVRAYVINSGIRTTHVDFQGRASHGYDVVDNDPIADDCNGHGTHIASTIAGIDWVTDHGVRPAAVNMSVGGFGQDRTPQQF
jgi:subtilisin family serine protease